MRHCDWIRAFTWRVRKKTCRPGAILKCGIFISTRKIALKAHIKTVKNFLIRKGIRNSNCRLMYRSIYSFSDIDRGRNFSQVRKTIYRPKRKSTIVISLVETRNGWIIHQFIWKRITANIASCFHVFYT